MSRSVKEIVGRLEAAGFMIEKAYTHDQLLDGVKGFEQAALREVFREGYSDSLRAYDLSAHFRDMASRYALCDTEVYGRLSWGLQRLSREISALVNGARGERYMARALGWLKCENEVLLNVELEYEGERCEYDAIVVTPAGIDIVSSRLPRRAPSLARASEASSSSPTTTPTSRTASGSWKCATAARSARLSRGGGARRSTVTRGQRWLMPSRTPSRLSSTSHRLTSTSSARTSRTSS